MLSVELKIEPSKIHGYGLFATKDIKKGDEIWCGVKGFEKKINENYYYTLNNVQKKFVNVYFPHHNEKLHIFCDYSIFLNHSDDPNVKNISTKKVIAIKDIKRGEELVGNYDELH